MTSGNPWLSDVPDMHGYYQDITLHKILKIINKTFECIRVDFIFPPNARSFLSFPTAILHPPRYMENNETVSVLSHCELGFISYTWKN